MSSSISSRMPACYYGHAQCIRISCMIIFSFTIIIHVINHCVSLQACVRCDYKQCNDREADILDMGNNIIVNDDCILVTVPTLTFFHPLSLFHLLSPFSLLLVRLSCYFTFINSSGISFLAITKVAFIFFFGVQQLPHSLRPMAVEYCFHHLWTFLLPHRAFISINPSSTAQLFHDT